MLFSADTCSRQSMSFNLLRKMKNIVFGLGSGLFLVGCVSTQETFNADGSKGHVISCTPALTSGLVGAIANAATNWGTCYQKAGDMCGVRGYTVLTKSDEPGFAAEVGRYGGHATTTNNRMMIVRCNGPDPMPAKTPQP